MLHAELNPGKGEYNEHSTAVFVLSHFQEKDFCMSCIFLYSYKIMFNSEGFHWVLGNIPRAELLGTSTGVG